MRDDRDEDASCEHIERHKGCTEHCRDNDAGQSLVRVHEAEQEKADCDRDDCVPGGREQQSG